MAINLNHSRKDWNSEQVWRIEFWLLSVEYISAAKPTENDVFQQAEALLLEIVQIKRPLY